ncbi:MAG: TIGR00282 family metallophosphoesterase [Oscillospiraceae bacterium]|nr:TIGR00282 family metallophosphoesterase [Oscillospiraceae bacterium]
MRVLFIGDVVGKGGCDALFAELREMKRELSAELVIVNGENSAEGNGIDPRSAAMIFDAGADVITTGNHTFRKKSIDEELERNDRLLRPANYGEDIFGRGITTLDFGSFSVAVINLLGTTFLQPIENPFRYADRMLDGLNARVVIVDFHAEATSEKRAMGYYLAGRVSAVIGTHTHVTTADEQIIDGTGYITDVGMTGAKESILGVEKEIIIEKFLTYYPKKHVFAGGDIEINGALLDIDTKSGRCTDIRRIRKIHAQK